MYCADPTVFDTFPWPQFEMGSATVPVAESGVAPDSPSAGSIPARKSVGRSFRREADAFEGRREDAPTGGRDALAPRDRVWLRGGSQESKIRAVAEAGREVRRVRAEALRKLKGGLRALYRTLELPGANPLKDAHAALDAAVLAAYGFDPKQDLLAQLLALNLDVAARIERGERVTAPGLPSGFPNPESLVTADCIRPPCCDTVCPATSDR